MSKKVVIAIAVALVVALVAGVWATSTVLAQGEGPPRQGIIGRLRALAANGNSPLTRLLRARPTLGQVTEIGVDQFTILKRDGEEQTFLVDENTRFRTREESELSFDDLQVGGWVAVVAPRDQEQPTARGVLILPEDFDPDALGGTRGVVIDVDLGADEFTLQPRLGEALTVAVNEETVFRGGVESLDDLEEGMQASVLTQETEDGGLLAKAVSANYPLERKLGQVLAVDADAGTFTLKTRQGDEELTITVDENTRFRSREGAIAGLEGLQPGMVAGAMVRAMPDGELLAVTVLAVDRNRLPQFEKRAAGKIIAVGHNTFTIQARDGQEYTFKVTGETTFRGRGVQVQDIEDLQEGMRVIVGAKELGNGEFHAQLVIVFPPLAE